MPRLHQNFTKKIIKDAMVAMDRPESLKNMINIAVKIDDRQYNKFGNKKTQFKPIPKNKPQFKKDFIKFDATNIYIYIVTFAGNWVI